MVRISILLFKLNIHEFIPFQANSESLKPITKLCKKYLCIPAGSTESERTFSKAGQIVSDRKASLIPKVVDMLLYLYLFLIYFLTFYL